MPRPKTSSDFTTQAEGRYLFECDSVEFYASEKAHNKGDLICKVSHKIIDGLENGSEFNETKISEWFALEHTFSVESLLGLMSVSVGLPDKDYPDDFFKDDKTQAKTAKQLVGSQYGGKVKHEPGEKEGSTFAKVVEYYTKKEYAGFNAEAAPVAETASDNGSSEASGSGGDNWD